MDELTPDDTLPDDAYADTIAEMAALVDMTMPDFKVPKSAHPFWNDGSAGKEEE